MELLIAPSVLAADFAHLGRAVEMLNESAADWIHVDVMDGAFVPNISFGEPVVSALARHARKPLDAHLMIEDPDRYLPVFKKAGADHLTVHYEACPHLHRTLQHIRDLGARTGVALNPHTPVHVLADVLPLVDIALVMSVNPGFGGQQFIERTYEKVRALRALIDAQGTGTLIEVDGGVGVDHARPLREAGAHALVAGSSVFRAEDPVATIAQLKNC